MKFSKSIIFTVLVIMFATLAIGYFYWKQRSNNYDLVNPRRGSVVEAIYGLGKVKTNQFFEAKIGVVRVVKKLYVKEGQEVKKGRPLVALDESAFFSAPFTGTVTLVAFREAQPVFPQQTIVRLENMDDLYIEVSLEQQGALRIKKGQTATILFESLRNVKYQGKVDSIFPQADDFIAHIQVAKMTDNILPGMTADVAIEVGKKDNVLLIPLAAINNGRVIVLRNEKKIVQNVTLGQVDQSWAEVIDNSILDTDQLILKRN
jgi:multidrug efflux pump subunit AcrA (membrane-fusion protein)